MKHILAVFVLLVFSCGESKKESGNGQFTLKKAEKVDLMNDKGVGPITNVTLGAVNQTMVAEGKALFML